MKKKQIIITIAVFVILLTLLVSYIVITQTQDKKDPSKKLGENPITVKEEFTILDQEQNQAEIYVEE